MIDETKEWITLRSTELYYRITKIEDNLKKIPPSHFNDLKKDLEIQKVEMNIVNLFNELIILIELFKSNDKRSEKKEKPKMSLEKYSYLKTSLKRIKEELFSYNLNSFDLDRYNDYIKYIAQTRELIAYHIYDFEWRLKKSFNDYISNYRIDQIDKFFEGKTLLIDHLLENLVFNSKLELINFLKANNISYEINESFITLNRNIAKKPEIELQLSQLTTKFSVKCVGHLERVNLLEALKKEWGICKHCYSYICPTCAKNFKTCPNIGGKEHQLEVIGLPIENLIQFISSNIINKKEYLDDVIIIDKNEKENNSQNYKW